MTFVEILLVGFGGEEDTVDFCDDTEALTGGAAEPMDFPLDEAVFVFIDFASTASSPALPRRRGLEEEVAIAD
ncbi:hypothetical protein CREGCYN_06080 [Synechococcus sp. M16CYN]